MDFVELPVMINAFNFIYSNATPLHYKTALASN